jgi:paraquat-inducible protein B
VIGQVTDVHIEYDNATRQVNVPITIEVEADRVKLLHENNDPAKFESNAYDTFRTFIAQGLRAHLGSGNLLTGQKVINLDFTDDTTSAALIEGGIYPEIPTIDPDDLDSVIHSAKELLNSLHTTVATLNKAITSPQMVQSLRSLNDSLVNLDRITHDASVNVGPLLQSLQTVAGSADAALKQADKAIASSDGGGDLAGAIHELKDAARSIRVLADYLESHPEALLRGKTGKVVQ